MTSGTTGSARFEDANQQGDRAQAAMGHKAEGERMRRRADFDSKLWF